MPIEWAPQAPGILQHHNPCKRGVSGSTGDDHGSSVIHVSETCLRDWDTELDGCVKSRADIPTHNLLQYRCNQLTFRNAQRFGKTRGLVADGPGPVPR